ncbi:MAG: ECF transporter S component [Bacteroides sp.]|nr:ECF transporter S component [Eubacterium sp.]MCM1417442.1 ECF transporter S component [Roseburia sp.]MCM1461622.1 ECF transporter S component [Bacteroides sp.]
MTQSNALQKPRLSVKAQTLATLAAIVAAVAVPQIFHVIGSISGMGTSLGETFLPMHLPIILVGLLAGPYVGAISGLLGSALSFLLTGMPGATMLPFMMIELFVYGLTAGLLRNVKLPAVVKVLIVQVAGRLIRAGAILLAVYAFGNESIKVATIWNSIATGLFGLVLQWVLLPLILFRVEHAKQ